MKRGAKRSAVAAGSSRGLRVVPDDLALVSSHRIVTSMTATLPLPWIEPLERWEEWMCAADRPPTTQYLRNYQLRRYAFDHGDPWSATTDDLVAWIAHQDWASETKRSYRAALRSFYTWAHLTGRIPSNPAGLLPPIKPPVRAPRPTPEPILAAALLVANSRVALMVNLAARLGLRRAEIAQVHSDDVERDLLGWSLRVHGKGSKERRVPLCDEMRMLLQELPDGFAFPGQILGHLSPAYVGKLVSAVLGPKWTTHSLRHRFGTNCYAQGRDLLAVQVLLGHSKPETTRLYVLIPDDSLRAAIAWAA